MNKKGFTLIEMLAVITIITIIGIIVVPIIGNTLKEQKQELYDVQIRNIEDATSNYVNENFMTIDIPNESTKGIHLKYLKENGYIDQKVTNPKTNEEFNNNLVILITNNNNVYTYKVCTSEVECDTNVTFLD